MDKERGRLSITVTLPKPITSNSKAEGRFGKQDFRDIAEEDVYSAGERLAYSYTTEDKGSVLHRYRTNACQNCAIKHSCTTAKERLIFRWEHEHILEAVQRRLNEHPEKMRQRRETVEHPFGTIKARMGATHFLMKTLPRVASEMALHVLAYNLTRVINIMGVQPLMAAIRGHSQNRNGPRIVSSPMSHPTKRFDPTKTHSVHLLRDCGALRRIAQGAGYRHSLGSSLVV